MTGEARATIHRDGRGERVYVVFQRDAASCFARRWYESETHARRSLERLGYRAARRGADRAGALAVYAP